MQNVVFLSPTTAKAGFDSRPEQDSLVVCNKSTQALVPGMELTTHPHLSPSLRMSGAIPPLHLHASMALTRAVMGKLFRSGQKKNRRAIMIYYKTQ